MALRICISRYTDIYNTKSYVDILPSILENYNSSYHRTLKEKPINVLKYNKVPTQKINNPHKLPVGSIVRISLKRSRFAKGSKPYWSKTLYEGLGHQLIALNSGKIQHRTFKNCELSKATKPTEIQRRTTRNRAKQAKLIKEDKIAKKLKRLGLN